MVFLGMVDSQRGEHGVEGVRREVVVAESEASRSSKGEGEHGPA
jgi:hypothetical protein